MLKRVKKRAKHLKIWVKMYKILKYFEKGQVIVQGFPQVLRTWGESLLKFDEGGGAGGGVESIHGRSMGGLEHC